MPDERSSPEEIAAYRSHWTVVQIVSAVVIRERLARKRKERPVVSHDGLEPGLPYRSCRVTGEDSAELLIVSAEWANREGSLRGEVADFLEAHRL